MRKLGLVTIITLCFWGMSHAWAMNAQPQLRRVALIIANNKYEHAEVLATAGADGHAIEAVLRERGFEVLAGYDLDRRRMNRLVADFLARLSAGTIAIFYFSGHGVQIGGDNYLIPTDMRAEREADVADDGLNLGHVIQQMGAANDGFNLAIVDACRDNPFHVAGRALGGTRGLAPTTASGAMVVYAAGANQQAIDRLGPSDRDRNGLFTREFLKVIRTPGLPIRDAIAEVKLSVAKQAAAVGAKQTPAVYDEATGDFSFTPAAAVVPPRPTPAPALVQPPPLPAPATVPTPAPEPAMAPSAPRVDDYCMGRNALSCTTPEGRHR